MKITLELEILNKENEWEVKHQYYCNDFTHIPSKIKMIKQTYALHNKEYRIFLRMPSKLNEKRV